jgi:hypothetical protein
MLETQVARKKRDMLYFKGIRANKGAEWAIAHFLFDDEAVNARTTIEGY